MTVITILYAGSVLNTFGNNSIYHGKVVFCGPLRQLLMMWMISSQRVWCSQHFLSQIGDLEELLLLSSIKPFVVILWCWMAKARWNMMHVPQVCLRKVTLLSNVSADECFVPTFLSKLSLSSYLLRTKWNSHAPRKSIQEFCFYTYFQSVIIFIV